MDAAGNFIKKETVGIGNHTAKLKRAVAGDDMVVVVTELKANELLCNKDCNGVHVARENRNERRWLHKSPKKRVRYKPDFYNMPKKAYCDLIYAKHKGVKHLKEELRTFEPVTEQKDGYCYLAGVPFIFRPLLQSIFGCNPLSSAFLHPLVDSLDKSGLLLNLRVKRCGVRQVHVTSSQKGIKLSHLPYIGNVRVGGRSKPVQVPIGVVERKTAEDRFALLKLHEAVYTHALHCSGACSFQNCRKMKDLIGHTARCARMDCNTKRRLESLKRFSDLRFCCIIAAKFPGSPLSKALGKIDLKASYQPYVPGYCYLYAIPAHPYQRVVRAWLASYFGDYPSMDMFDDDVIRYLETKRYLVGVMLTATRTPGLYHCEHSARGSCLVSLSDLPGMGPGRVGAAAYMIDEIGERETLRIRNTHLLNAVFAYRNVAVEAQCLVTFAAGYLFVTHVVGCWLDQDTTPLNMLILAIVAFRLNAALSEAEQASKKDIDKGWCYRKAWAGDIGKDPDALTLATVALSVPRLLQTGRFLFVAIDGDLHLNQNDNGLPSLVLFAKLHEGRVVTDCGEIPLQPGATVGRSGFSVVDFCDVILGLSVGDFVYNAILFVYFVWYVVNQVHFFVFFKLGIGTCYAHGEKAIELFETFGPFPFASTIRDSHMAKSFAWDGFLPFGRYTGTWLCHFEVAASEETILDVPSHCWIVGQRPSWYLVAVLTWSGLLLAETSRPTQVYHWVKRKLDVLNQAKPLTRFRQSWLRFTRIFGEDRAFMKDMAKFGEVGNCHRRCWKKEPPVELPPIVQGKVLFDALTAHYAQTVDFVHVRTRILDEKIYVHVTRRRSDPMMSMDEFLGFLDEFPDCRVGFDPAQLEKAGYKKTERHDSSIYRVLNPFWFSFFWCHNWECWFVLCLGYSCLTRNPYYEIEFSKAGLVDVGRRVLILGPTIYLRAEKLMLALLALRLFSGLLKPKIERWCFCPFGSRGDIIPIEYVARKAKEDGFPVEFIPCDETKGRRILAAVERGQVHQNIPSYIEWGITLTDLARDGNIVVAPHGVVGIPNNAVSYSCSPDPWDMTRFSFYPEKFAEKKWICACMNWVGRVLVAFETPGFRIGVTKGCVPRSSDGINALTVETNHENGTATFQLGSSAYEEPAVTFEAFSSRPTSKHVLETETDHSVLFKERQYVITHGGAGTVQTALAKGCEVYSRGGILDRDLQPWIAFSQDVSMTYMYVAIMMKMPLLNALMAIYESALSFGEKTNLVGELLFNHILDSSCNAAVLKPEITRVNRLISKGWSWHQMIMSFVLPEFLAKNGIVCGMFSALFTFFTACYPFEVIGACAWAACTFFNGLYYNRASLLRYFSGVGFVNGTIVAQSVRDLLHKYHKNLLLWVFVITKWAMGSHHMSVDNIWLEFCYLESGVWSKFFFHTRLLNPLTGQTIAISTGSEGVTKMIDEKEEVMPTIYKFDTGIPVEDFDECAAFLKSQTDQAYSPVNNCQTNLLVLLGKNFGKVNEVTLTVLFMTTTYTFFGFIILAVLIIPPVTVYVLTGSDGGAGPVTQRISQILSSAGTGTGLSLNGLVNFLTLRTENERKWMKAQLSKHVPKKIEEFEHKMSIKTSMTFFDGKVVTPTDKTAYMIGKPGVETMKLWKSFGYSIAFIRENDLVEGDADHAVVDASFSFHHHACLLNFATRTGSATVSLGHGCKGMFRNMMIQQNGKGNSVLWLVENEPAIVEPDFIPSNIYVGRLVGERLYVFHETFMVTEDGTEMRNAYVAKGVEKSQDLISYRAGQVWVGTKQYDVNEMALHLSDHLEVGYDFVEMLLANGKAFVHKLKKLEAYCEKELTENCSSKTLKVYRSVRNALSIFGHKRSRFRAGHIPPIRPHYSTFLKENGLALNPNPTFVPDDFTSCLMHTTNIINNALGNRANTQWTEYQFRRSVNHNQYITTYLQNDARQWTDGDIAGVDGQLFACKPVMIASLARYIHSDTVNALLDDDVRKVARLLVERDPDLYLNATPADPKKLWKFQLKGSKRKMSAGLPFIGIPGIKKRADLDKKGYREAVIAAAKEPLLTGVWRPALAHAFPKSQVVKQSKLKKGLDALRTVTATSLINNMQQLVFNFDVNNRHAPFTAPGKPGLILNGSGLSTVFEQASKRKYSYSLDMSKFDSTIPLTLLKGVYEIRKLGYENHPLADAICKHLDCQLKQGQMAHIVNLVADSPEKVLDGLDEANRSLFEEICGDQMPGIIEFIKDKFSDHDVAPGGVVAKEVGGLTGDVNTTFNNTVATQIAIVILVCRSANIAIEEFFMYNDIANTGDDNILSTDLELDIVKLIEDAENELGIKMRVESTGKTIFDQVFLGKSAKPGEDFREDFDMIGIKPPKYAVLHQTDTLALRYANWKCDKKARMKSQLSKLEYMVEKGNGYLALCAHQPNVYNSIRSRIDENRSSLQRLCQKNGDQKRFVTFCKKHPTPSYKKVLQDWYKPISLETMSEVQALKMEISFEAQIEGFVQRFIRSAEVFIDNFTPHLWPMEDDEVRFVRENIDGEGLFEEHLYLTLCKNGPVDEETFVNRAESSPFRSMMRPRSWFRVQSRLLPSSGLEYELFANYASAKVIIYTVLVQRVESILTWFDWFPLWQLFRHCLNGYLFILPQYVSTASFLHYLGVGEASQRLNSLLPKDRYRVHKRIGMWLFRLIPDIPFLCYLPVADCLTGMSIAVEEATRFLDVNLGLDKTEELVNAPPVDDAWAVATRKALALVEEGQIPVITAPTGTGKTLYCPARCLDSRLHGEKIRQVLVVMPRNILCGEWSAKSKAQWMRKGNTTTAPLMTCTYGYLATVLATGDTRLIDDSLVIFDEAHERSVEWSYIQNHWIRRIRTILLSATPRCLSDQYVHVKVDVEPLHEIETEILTNAKLMDVIVENANKARRMLIIHPSRSHCERIARQMKGIGLKVAVCSSKSRRIPPVDYHVVATAIADAGLTIPGCDLVIDSGLRHVNDGGELRVNLPIDNATMIQRRGRTGRTCKGRYVLLRQPIDKNYEPAPDIVSLLTGSIVHCSVGVKNELERPFDNHLPGNNYARVKKQPPAHLLKAVSLMHALELLDRRNYQDMYEDIAHGCAGEEFDHLLKTINISQKDLYPCDVVEEATRNSRIFYKMAGVEYENVMVKNHKIICF